jgi:hypothetical protein
MSGQAYRTGIETTTQAHMRVFVLLAYTFGAQRWKESWARGEIPGIQERLPYGYFHCAGETCEIRYSEDARESRLVRFLRMCLRRVIGFDLIHAWRNREGIVQMLCGLTAKSSISQSCYCFASDWRETEDLV